MGNKEEKNNTVPNGSTEITGRRHKSARPGEFRMYRSVMKILHLMNHLFVRSIKD